MPSEVIWTVVVANNVHRYLFEDVIHVEHCDKNKAGVGPGGNFHAVQVRGLEHRKGIRTTIQDLHQESSRGWRRWSSTIGG